MLSIYFDNYQGFQINMKGCFVVKQSTTDEKHQPFRKARYKKDRYACKPGNGKNAIISSNSLG
jgi:hypothetical protein